MSSLIDCILVCALACARVRRGGVQSEETRRRHVRNTLEHLLNGLKVRVLAAGADQGVRIHGLHALQILEARQRAVRA